MLSIVIPAYNEEKFLPSLLDSIKRQKYQCEIIIADNNSRDRTTEIAKKYRCRIAKGGPPGMARNNGARAAKNDILFLDADVVLPENFLKDFMKKIGGLDFATCRIVPITDSSHHRFVYMLRNIGNIIFPHHVSGQCLFVRKELFTRVKGFDESVMMGEEHELAQRLHKSGNGKYFSDIYVLNHPRRLEKEGSYRTLAKDIFSEAHRMVFGPARKELYKKEYGHY